MDWKKVGSWTWKIMKLLALAVTVGFVFEHLGYLGVVPLLLLIIVVQTYRAYIKKDDVLYLAREQLEGTICYKPFSQYQKGEKIRFKKFVWRKSK